MDPVELGEHVVGVASGDPLAKALVDQFTVSHPIIEGREPIVFSESDEFHDSGGNALGAR